MFRWEGPDIAIWGPPQTSDLVINIKTLTAGEPERLQPAFGLTPRAKHRDFLFPPRVLWGVLG